MDVLIPLAAISLPFLMVIAIVAIPAWLKSRERREMQATLRMAIEKGQPVPPEVIDAITRDRKIAPTSHSDLRTGMIWLAVGLGVAAFGAVIGYQEQEALHPLLGIAAIPGLIGLAFIVLSIFNPNKAKAS